jgi:catecholate siderophore receptor
MIKLSAPNLVLSLSASILIAAGSSAGAQVPRSATDSVSADSSSRSTKKETGRPQTLEAVRIEGRRDKSRYVPGYTRTATKTPALARDVPQSMVSVTSALVRDQGMQSIADVVRYIPGASIGQGEGNRDQATLRGNSSTADFFVNGVRDDAQYFRDLYNLVRVEALKGPNAMVFGRGGGGGVINRVIKEPRWTTSRYVNVDAGTFGGRRVSTDVEQKVSPFLSARINSVYENSSSFRDEVSLERSGVNPTFSVATLSRRTGMVVGYEHFEDRRTADRGIPSFQGKPVDTEPSTFFGNPDENSSRVKLDAATATISHDAGKLQLRNNTRFAHYDKSYQNIYPGSVAASGSDVNLVAYSNAIGRHNIFNQTDITWTASAGRVRHDLLAGAEVGRQATDNFRRTGYFGENATSLLVPLSAPTTATSATFRQSATDADNGSVVTTASLYLQDQIALSRQLRVIAGARYERFGIRFKDQRSETELTRDDEMISPRAGVVFKPADLVSLYASYSLSFLPGSGDQFTTLTTATSALEPERFANYETGVKWDALDRLALTAAVYRLDRTNTRAQDPADPTRFVQTGAQRSQGVELGATGSVTPKWEIAGGFARQNATITSATASSAAGARVPLVPHTSISLWNRYSLTSSFGAALGVIRQADVFAAIDNTVTLPAFTRFDAAVFTKIGWGLEAQMNIENLFDVKYYPTSNGNNNIAPGAPRSARVSVRAAF